MRRTIPIWIQICILRNILSFYRLYAVFKPSGAAHEVFDLPL